LTAKGENLDWAAYIPAVPPDEENIFKAPKITEWFVGREPSELSRLLRPEQFYDYVRRANHAATFLTVAEWTLTSDTNFDRRGYDAVLASGARAPGLGMHVFMRPRLAADQAIHTSAAGAKREIIPLVVFEEVPFVDAITNLAQQDGLKYSFDPGISPGRTDTSWLTEVPLITASYEDQTVEQVLYDVLDQYGLQWIDDPSTGEGRITIKDSRAHATLGYPGPGEQMQQLFRRALGRQAVSSQGFTLISDRDAIRPVRLLTVGRLNEDGMAASIPAEALSSLVSGTNDFTVEHVAGNTFRVVLNSPQIYTAADYLAWSSQYEPQFDLIRAALKRPSARMEGDYLKHFGMPMPNYVTYRAVVQTLLQRAQAFLLLGEPDKALRELTLVHDLRRMVLVKPVTMVAAMIDVAVNGLYANVVADGLRLHAWREPQLVEIQKQLEEINNAATLVDSLRSERAGTLCALDRALVPSKWGPRRMFGLPHGWYLQNLVTIASMDQRMIEGLDPTNGVIRVDEINACSRKVEMEYSRFRPYTWLAAIASPNFKMAFGTAAGNQARISEALVACGLERYRVEHKCYPGSLHALSPRFVAKLPVDVVGGLPLHYCRADDGDFILYSIAWNRLDDRGIAAPKPCNTIADGGDWIWVSGAQ
jgi:hypothetical protein